MTGDGARSLIEQISSAINAPDLDAFPGSLDGPCWTRTSDLGIKSPLLYQLSYRPAGQHGRARGALRPERPPPVGRP